MGKKIIVRIDDVGYTDINNMGAFEVFDKGIGTAADVMLDTPGAKDALARLKDYPWLSIGWHTHFWGSPVLGADKVPSLMDKSGNGHFRSDLSRLTEGIDYDELVAEMRAQINMCISILGKAPDTTETMAPEESLFAKAKREVAAEYGIIMDFAKRVRTDRETGERSFSKVDEKWAGRNVYWMDPGPAYADLFSDSIEQMGNYDPVKYYTEDKGDMASFPEDAIFGQAWHPGFVDYYMCREGDKGPKARNFIECRPIDMHALCSEEIKTWVKENKVELMSFTDALYGRQDYQNHLKSIGSDLCMI